MQPKAQQVFVHESAIVEDGASIGTGTKIWHHAHVRSGARIGADCSFGKGVFVDTGVVIGDRVRVQNGVSVYAGVTICSDVLVGPAAVFTNDLRPRSRSNWQPVPTLVQSGASIGANATIVCGTVIGEWAMVGAAAVVTRDVPSHALVVGNPARIVGWIDEAGDVVSRDAKCPERFRDDGQ